MSQPEDAKAPVDFGVFEESVQISENHTDTVRVRAIYSKTLEISYFVAVATNLVSELKIFNHKMELIYTRNFESDIYVVDFELMFNHQILVLICEDCINNTREVMAINYANNEYIHPPTVPNLYFIFGLRSVHNQTLLIATSISILEFYYNPKENLFQQVNSVRTFSYKNLWVQIEVDHHSDLLYVFYKENFRGYKYSGRTYLEAIQLYNSQPHNQNAPQYITGYEDTRGQY